MALDLDYVRKVAPELEDLDDDTVNFWLEQAMNFVSKPAWGAKYDLGVAVLTAHYALSNIQGEDNSTTHGLVQTEKVGDLSRTYFSTGSDIPEEFVTTNYGIWFYNMRKYIRNTPIII